MLLLPCAVLTMKLQRNFSAVSPPHELSHRGRLAWFFNLPFFEDFKSPVGDGLEHKQMLANHAETNPKHVLERELNRGNGLWRPAVLTLVTLFWFTTVNYPLALVTLILRRIVSSGWMDPGSM